LIDWFERFKPRYATREDWDKHLIPALRDVVQVLEEHAPGRSIDADGRLSLPAAVALGCALMATKNIKVRWAQHTLGRSDQWWSIEAKQKHCALSITGHPRDPNGRDLAVLVSVTNDVELVFKSSLSELPRFRAIVQGSVPAFGTEVITNAGQAANAAFQIRNAIKTAKNSYPEITCVHLFMAVPAGLALMIGQLLNLPVKVQTYDLVETDAGSRYQAAAEINPYLH
jgi:hypothetical protein